MRRTTSLPPVVALGFLTCLASLTSASDAQAYEFDATEAAYQALYLATPIQLTGRVVDELGQPIEGAQLELRAWGDNADNDGEATSTWLDGQFTFGGLARRNAMLAITVAGDYYGENVPISLQVELGQTEVDLGDIVLTAKQFGRARLTFGGDAMFDRRMFTDDVIDDQNIGPDTRDLFRFMEGVLHADDHTAINLETPVTADRSTPHPTKSYVFGAYPDSAAELPGVGVDSVSLGNNHIYDYLEIGVEDTIFYLDQLGLPWYGAGMSRDESETTTYRPTINGLAVSMQGFSELTGGNYGGDELKTIALRDPDKAGALPSYTNVLEDFVEDEVAAGRFAIPIIHGGTEYAPYQNAGMHNDFETAVANGAGLVIAHHPHTAQGVQVIQTVDGPRFVFSSLGNFVFDQTIYETMRSYLAVVDIAETGGGVEVEKIRLVPFRLDDYAPRPMAGTALERMGRHLAHLSTNEAPVSGFDRAVVFAEGGRLVVTSDESEAQTSDLLDARSVSVSGGSTGAVSLERFTANDALAALSTDTPASCELGRDLLNIGDFEELDVDDEYGEPGLWTVSSSRYVQNSETHSGTGAAVLLRTSSNSGRTSMWLDKELEIEANHAMTLTGWHKGNNSGEFRIYVRFRTNGGSTITYRREYDFETPDHDWTQFNIDVTAPANAESIKVYFRHYPPDANGEGQLFLDDVEFIDWDPSATVDVDAQGTQVPTPNAWDYVRCAAPDGDLGLDLTHRVYESM